MLVYGLKATFTDAHTDAINCLAFSPDGSYIISGSSDRDIVIWSLASTEAVCRIRTHSEVLSLLWSSTCGILAGTADGTLLTEIFEALEDSVVVSGFTAHSKSIENLAVNPTSRASLHLASAAHETVKLWTRDGTDWIFACTLDQPRPTPFSGDHPVIVTSIQWMDSPFVDHLVIAYLYHGIICAEWGDEKASVRWSIHLPMCGSCSVSPTNDSLALCNVASGYDVYAIPSGQHQFAIQVPGEQPGMPLPVLHVHGGQYLTAGTANGRVRVWDNDRAGSERSLEKRHVQTLRPGDTTIVQALAAAPLKESGMFRIAAGGSMPETSNCIDVWETEDVAE